MIGRKDFRLCLGGRKMKVFPTVQPIMTSLTKYCHYRRNAMFAFLRRGLRKQRQSERAKRAAYDELLKQETEYQLRVNELNRKIEKQQQRQREILAKGKRESGELAKLGLAEQYARGERQVRRLLDRRKLLVKAQELIEVQLANLDLQDAFPEAILNLSNPDTQRERALADMIRDRLEQAYDDMVAGFESESADDHRETHEKAAIQSVLDLFARERDEEIQLTLHAIEEDLNGPHRHSLFAHPEE